MRRNGNTGEGKHGHEGALGRINFTPGVYHQNDDQGAHVEDENTDRHGVDSLRQGHRGVLSLGGGSTYQFGPHKGEDRNLEGA